MSNYSTNLRFYVPSGEFSLFGAVVTLIVALAAAIPLSFLYALGVLHVPSVYISIILTLGLAYVLAVIVTVGAKKLRIRNSVVGMLIAFLAGLTAYIFHWPAYVAMLLADSNEAAFDFPVIFDILRQIIEQPEGLPDIIKNILEVGVWSLGNSANAPAVNGPFLLIIWIIEFLIFVLAPVFWVKNNLAQPYSEKSGKWLKASEMPLPIAYVEEVSAMERAFAMNDFEALSQPLPDEAIAEKYALVTVYYDDFTSFVTVTNVILSGSGKKQKKKEKIVFKFLAVSPEVAQKTASALGGVLNA